MVQSVITVIVGSLLLCSSVVAGEVVKLDANESRPFLSPSLAKDGMVGEIIHAASAAAGIESQIIYKPLKRMIENDSNNDLGNPMFFMNNQDFSAVVPLAVYHVSLFYYRPKHGHAHEIVSVESLKDHRVGLLSGTLVNRSAFKRAGIVFEESYAHASLFRKLHKGRLDVVIEVDLVGRAFIQDLFPEEVENFGVTRMPQSASPIALNMAVNQPEAAALAARYREGLRKIRESGEYRAILQKYYGEQIPADYEQQLDRFGYIYQEVSQ
ncbi:transporter substrate-binding domain-containing protein [Mariprofundus sp. KV]|nr:transporter substrate-binding domain-containing protein [Mariprofundus sp. KV]